MHIISLFTSGVIYPLKCGKRVRNDCMARAQNVAHHYHTAPLLALGKSPSTLCQQRLCAPLNLLQRTATADYFLNFELIDFTSPTNLIATGMCCNEAEEVGSCVTECDVLINICIRPSNSELPRDMSNCPILNQIVVQSNTNEILSPWPVSNSVKETAQPRVCVCMQGGVQLLMFAIEGDGTFVDTFEVEHTATAAQSGEQVTTVELTVLTDHSILMVSVSIQCVFGFHGPNCDCEDTDDSTGHFTCTATGERECLEGYQNPDTNCVECVTAQGCCE